MNVGRLDGSSSAAPSHLLRDEIAAFGSKQAPFFEQLGVDWIEESGGQPGGPKKGDLGRVGVRVWSRVPSVQPKCDELAAGIEADSVAVGPREPDSTHGGPAELLQFPFEVPERGLRSLEVAARGVG